MTASGAFVPGGHAAYPAFEQWRGAPLQYAHDFAPGRAWADVELPDWWLRGWGSSPYLDRMVVSLRMLPNDGSGTLATGATGAYNWHFRRAARRLVARGMGQALVRVGWEANGGWFRWSAKPDPRSWLAYYRQIVLTMRSVAPGLRFVWCMSANWNGLDPVSIYDPAVVDVIGIDTYDTWWGHPTATPEERWQHLVTPDRHGGLDWWAGFAREQGKPLMVCEWGLATTDPQRGGGGDNPYYIQQMRDWMERNEVWAECYLNADASDGAHRLVSDHYPLAATEYRRLICGVEVEPPIGRPGPMPEPFPGPSPEPSPEPSPVPPPVPTPAPNGARLRPTPTPAPPAN